MKKIFGISMLAFGLLLAGCAKNSDSSSGAAGTAPYGVACIGGVCNGGTIGYGTAWSMTTLSQTLSGTTQIILNIQANSSNQVYVTGQLNATGSPDTCGWSGTYTFGFQTTINPSLIMAGNGVVALSGSSIPLGMGISGDIVLRQITSGQYAGAYSAYMKVIMPIQAYPYQAYNPFTGGSCSQYPVTMNYPGV